MAVWRCVTHTHAHAGTHTHTHAHTHTHTHTHTGTGTGTECAGLENTPFLTNTEALRLTTQPRKLIVIGGGYIATELGHM